MSAYMLDMVLLVGSELYWMTIPKLLTLHLSSYSVWVHAYNQ